LERVFSHHVPGPSCRIDLAFSRLASGTVVVLHIAFGYTTTNGIKILVYDAHDTSDQYILGLHAIYQPTETVIVIGVPVNGFVLGLPSVPRENGAEKLSFRTRLVWWAKKAADNKTAT